MTRSALGTMGAVGGLDELLAGLGEVQRTAVTCDDRVMCLLAGAGTGKTRVLTLRVARRLLDRSVKPGHALVCTFSRKAADELRVRLATLGAGAVEAGTLHRTALRLLGQHRADHGHAAPIVADRRTLLAAVMEDLGRPPQAPDHRRGGSQATRARPRRAGELARAEVEIAWAKARLLRPAEYAEAAAAGRRPGAGERTAQVYARYEELRRRRGVLDLDDLLWQCADVLESDDQFATAVRWRHRHVFVDEMQDLNEAQFRLVKLLAGDRPDLFVVGDPNQSIYAWNGADPGLLDRFPDEFPGTRVLRLEVNHRCSPQVVRAAAVVLGPRASVPTSTRPDGPAPKVVRLTTDAEEAAWVARQAWLAHRPGRRWSSIAVLARTNAQLVRLEEALRRERVPCRVAGADVAPASDLEDSPADDHDDPPTGTDDVPREPAPDNEHDAVVLSTFHRAKGLQWRTVFVVGLWQGSVPLASARSRGRDEERRLLYVALTRAEDELTCSWASHPDERAVAAGATPRNPCPWLAALERASAEVPALDGPDVAARQLARIRHELARTAAAERS